MERKKFKPIAYRPKSQTTDDIDAGLKRAFSGAGQQEMRPLSVEGRYQQKAGIPQSPWRPKLRQPVKEPEPEEPYWSAEQWEEWALKLYETYEDVKEILPAWFIEAVEAEEERQ
jgi:hypothetical protein